MAGSRCSERRHRPAEGRIQPCEPHLPGAAPAAGLAAGRDRAVGPVASGLEGRPSAPGRCTPAGEHKLRTAIPSTVTGHVHDQAVLYVDQTGSTPRKHAFCRRRWQTCMHTAWCTPT